MKKKIHQPQINSSRVALPVTSGGSGEITKDKAVEALSLISKTAYGQPGGAARLGADGYLVPSQISDEVLSLSPRLLITEPLPRGVWNKVQILGADMNTPLTFESETVQHVFNKEDMTVELFFEDSVTHSYRFCGKNGTFQGFDGKPKKTEIYNVWSTSEDEYRISVKPYDYSGIFVDCLLLEIERFNSSGEQIDIVPLSYSSDGIYSSSGPAGSYYIRARYVDINGVAGDWSETLVLGQGLKTDAFIKTIGTYHADISHNDEFVLSLENRDGKNISVVYRFEPAKNTYEYFSEIEYIGESRPVILQDGRIIGHRAVSGPNGKPLFQTIVSELSGNFYSNKVYSGSEYTGVSNRRVVGLTTGKSRNEKHIACFLERRTDRTDILIQMFNTETNAVSEYTLAIPNPKDINRPNEPDLYFGELVVSQDGNGIMTYYYYAAGMVLLKSGSKFIIPGNPTSITLHNFSIWNKDGNHGYKLSSDGYSVYTDYSWWGGSITLNYHAYGADGKQKPSVFKPRSEFIPSTGDGCFSRSVAALDSNKTIATVTYDSQNNVLPSLSVYESNFTLEGTVLRHYQPLRDFLNIEYKEDHWETYNVRPGKNKVVLFCSDYREKDTPDISRSYLRIMDLSKRKSRTLNQVLEGTAVNSKAGKSQLGNYAKLSPDGLTLMSVVADNGTTSFNTMLIFRRTNIGLPWRLIYTGTTTTEAFLGNGAYFYDNQTLVCSYYTDGFTLEASSVNKEAALLVYRITDTSVVKSSKITLPGLSSLTYAARGFGVTIGTDRKIYYCFGRDVAGTEYTTSRNLWIHVAEIANITHTASNSTITFKQIEGTNTYKRINLYRPDKFGIAHGTFMKISPDGRYLASSTHRHSDGRTIYIWDLENPRNPPISLIDHVDTRIDAGIRYFDPYFEFSLDSRGIVGFVSQFFGENLSNYTANTNKIFHLRFDDSEVRVIQEHDIGTDLPTLTKYVMSGHSVDFSPDLSKMFIGTLYGIIEYEVNIDGQYVFRSITPHSQAGTRTTGLVTYDHTSDGLIMCKVGVLSTMPSAGTGDSATITRYLEYYK